MAVTATRAAELEAILSRHQPESELSRLNRDGRLTHASQPLLELITQSTQISDVTGGAFDITIKPLLICTSIIRNKAHCRRRQPLSDRPLVNYQNIRINGRTITFAQQGMSITLDGIAKGYIVDAGTAVLRQYGFANVMVEAGGDLMASGKKDAGQPWQIGIRSPRSQAGSLIATYNVSNQAAATSGDYMQPFTADLSQHHILDPHTGRSAPELASVTIIAPSAMLADGLATAVSVLGPEAGFNLINHLDPIEALLVTITGRIRQSEGVSLG